MAVIQQIKVPLISVNDTSLTVVNIPYEQGGAIKKGDIILVFETSKTTYDVLAEEDGFIGYSCLPDTEYEVNEVVANIYTTQAEVPVLIVNEKKISPVIDHPLHKHEEALATWEGDTLFSPSAIVMMESAAISKAAFKGRDFVSKEDVDQLLGLTTGRNIDAIKAPKQKQTPLLQTDSNKVIVEKLSSNKKREIEYLSAVQSTGLTSTINTSVDTAGIFVHINQSLQYLKNSLLPVILYETGRLLQKYKALNAYFTGDAIAYYKEVTIGFAIDIDKGLKVLKITDTAVKQIGEIENDIMVLSNKYLDDTLQIDDLTDISFTVTDLSSEGVSFFKPLVNMMNSAILGVSSIDTLQQRCMLSVTFDHRVTEGKLVARFLNELKGRLESYQSKHYPGLQQNIQCFKCYKSLQEDLSDVGFTKCITPKGEEAFICQSCLKGF